MLTHLLDAQDGRGVALWNCIPQKCGCVELEGVVKGPLLAVRGHPPQWEHVELALAPLTTGPPKFAGKGRRTPRGWRVRLEQVIASPHVVPRNRRSQRPADL